MKVIWKISSLITILGLFLSCSKDENKGGSASVATEKESYVNTLGVKLPADAAPVSKQVFRYMTREPRTLDSSVDVYAAGGSEFLFERLTMLDHNNELIKGAADSWEVSPDGLKWTFHLRPTGKWSDGSAVTAHDFEFTYKRMLSPASGNAYAFFYYDIKNARDYNIGKIKDPDAVGVKAIDDYTLVIETEKPTPYLPYVMAFVTSMPVPKRLVEKYGDNWVRPEHVISNSTFMVESWTPGEGMTFVLNPYYDGPNKAYIERIERLFTYLSQSTNAIIPYLDDEVDRIEVETMNLEMIKRNPELQKELVQYPIYRTYYLFFITRKPPFDDVRVRRAFAHALDKEAIVHKVLKGNAIVAHSMLPPGFPGYSGDKLASIQRFDLPLAEKLLTEAGYPNGEGFPEIELTSRIDQLDASLVGQAIAEMLQRHLRIKVRFRELPMHVYNQLQYNWEIPFSLIPFVYDYPDPQNMLGMIWHSQPRGYQRQDWKNEEFDRLIDEARHEMDHDRRMELYHQAEKILCEDVGGVFIFHSMVSELRKPWLKGIEKDRRGYYPFYGNNTSFCNIYIGKERK